MKDIDNKVIDLLQEHPDIKNVKMFQESTQTYWYYIREKPPEKVVQTHHMGGDYYPVSSYELVEGLIWRYTF